MVCLVRLVPHIRCSLCLCFLCGVSQSRTVISVMAALTGTVPLVVGLIFLLRSVQLYAAGLVVVDLGAAMVSLAGLFVVSLVGRCSLCLLGMCVRARVSRAART